MITGKIMAAAAAAIIVTSTGAQGHTPVSASTSSSLTYHAVAIDGFKIFYREAGPADGPTLLLLHGYPSSSRMFDTLMPLLADRHHVIAPDYPRFGQSDALSTDQFAHSFDHLGEVMVKFADTPALKRYVLYVQD